MLSRFHVSTLNIETNINLIEINFKIDFQVNNFSITFFAISLK